MRNDHTQTGRSPIGGRNSYGAHVRGYVHATYLADDTRAPRLAEPINGWLCDVQIIEPGWQGLLRAVPVMTASGGVDDHAHWKPRPCTRNLNGGALTPEGGPGATPPQNTDGDLVIVTFLGNDTNRPIIIGQAPHPGSVDLNPDPTNLYERTIATNTVKFAESGAITIDVKGNDLTIRHGDAVITISDNTVTINPTQHQSVVVQGDGVVVDGLDTTVVNGTLTSKSSATANAQAVLLNQMRVDIVSWIQSCTLALKEPVAIIGVPSVNLPALETATAKMVAAIGHTATNTTSD